MAQYNKFQLGLACSFLTGQSVDLKKLLTDIHEAAERDRLICFLRIYNCKHS